MESTQKTTEADASSPIDYMAECLNYYPKAVERIFKADKWLGSSICERSEVIWTENT